MRSSAFLAPFAVTAVALSLLACGSTTTTTSSSSSSTKSGSSGGSSSSSVSGSGSGGVLSSLPGGGPCGDAGTCSSTEVCIVTGENLSGEPRNPDGGAGSPGNIYDGLMCVPVALPCDPVSCGCIRCPGATQCSMPAGEGAPALAIASCLEPTG